MGAKLIKKVRSGKLSRLPRQTAILLLIGLLGLAGSLVLLYASTKSGRSAPGEWGVSSKGVTVEAAQASSNVTTVRDDALERGRNMVWSVSDSANSPAAAATVETELRLAGENNTAYNGVQICAHAKDVSGILAVTLEKADETALPELRTADYLSGDSGYSTGCVQYDYSDAFKAKYFNGSEQATVKIGFALSGNDTSKFSLWKLTLVYF